MIKEPQQWGSLGSLGTFGPWENKYLFSTAKFNATPGKTTLNEGWITLWGSREVDRQCTLQSAVSTDASLRTQSTHYHFYWCAFKFHELWGTRQNFLWILMHLISHGRTAAPCYDTCTLFLFLSAVLPITKIAINTSYYNWLRKFSWGGEEYSLFHKYEKDSLVCVQNRPAL